VGEATEGMATVEVARLTDANQLPRSMKHDKDILFTYVVQGNLELQVEGESKFFLQANDAFVIPPGRDYGFVRASEDLELLEVGLEIESQICTQTFSLQLP
jgi:quercetin dioxygenase-like cupin family protein